MRAKVRARTNSDLADLANTSLAALKSERVSARSLDHLTLNDRIAAYIIILYNLELKISKSKKLLGSSEQVMLHRMFQHNFCGIP